MGDKIILESLKALDNMDISTYKQALDIALKNKKNTNIALSGAYGSGKSSIVESYKNEYDVNFRFLHISLAEYTSDIDSNTKNEASKNRGRSYERNLEGKILNQLLHQIKSTKIPQTIFKVKKRANFWDLLFWSTSIPSIILLFSYLVGFNKWTEFVNDNFRESFPTFLEFSTDPKIRLISLGIIFFILSIFIYRITKLQINKGIIQKISVKGNEIEVLKESKESYFDRYLNDVIYLFENAGADVIVFEDIDRYNNSKIFEKLKEINTLVNQRNRRNWTQSRFIKFISTTKFFSKIKKWNAYKKIEQKFSSTRKVAFLYLLRDDMFVSKDRTKFFDMIIPVVPVIDASNSYEKFIEIFKNGNLLSLFDSNFLQKLSLYVDDMRLLKNIYNEFVIYQKELNTINLDLNKLLAIITYKNIFPRDFSELQLSRGFVYTLFSNKKNLLIQKKINESSEKLSQLNEQIEQSKKETLKNISELNAIFFDTDQKYRVNDSEENQFENRLEFIKELSDPKSKIEKYRSWYGGSSWDDVQNNIIFQDIEEIPEYGERKNNILNKEKDVQKQLFKEREETEQKIDKIKSLKLNQIISQKDIEELSITNILAEEEKFDEIKRNDYFLLLIFLIKNGYLDESYSDYMTYFYPNSLTKNDRVFLRSITDEKPLDYTYDLSNIEQIISRMDSYDFSKKEVWNYSLLNFMLIKYPKYSEKSDRIIISLSKARNLDFIKGLFMINKEKNNIIQNETLLEIIFTKWANFVKKLLDSDNGTNIAILETVLSTLETDIIDKQNTNEELTNYLNSSPEFLESIQDYSSILINNLRHLGAKFKSVNFMLIEPDTADAIYSNDLYEINFNNSKNVFEHFYSIQDEEAIIHKNYTEAKEVDADKFLMYINQNINTYVEEYLEFSEGTIFDKELYAYELINNEKLNKYQTEKYIRSLKTILSDITNVSDTDFWEILIEENNVEASGNNLLQYFIYNDNQWTDELVRFVNNANSKVTVNLSDITNQYGEINFFDSTVKQYNLNDTPYSSLVSSTGKRYYEGFPLIDVPDSKLSILIDNQIIEMSMGTLNDIRENYPDKVNSFAIKNLTTYLDIINDDELYDEKEILNILEDQNKIEIAECITNNISIVGKNYSEELIKYILKYKFDTNDLNDLINNLLNYSDSVQTIIANLAIEHLDKIIENKISVSNVQLLKKILDSKIGNLLLRKELFADSLSIFDKDTIKKYLNDLELPFEFLKLFQGKRPKFEINEQNNKILDYFRNEGWIYGYKKEGDFYRARGKVE